MFFTLYIGFWGVDLAKNLIIYYNKVFTLCWEEPYVAQSPVLYTSILFLYDKHNNLATRLRVEHLLRTLRSRVFDRK